MSRAALRATRIPRSPMTRHTGPETKSLLVGEMAFGSDYCPYQSDLVAWRSGISRMFGQLLGK